MTPSPAWHSLQSRSRRAVGDRPVLPLASSGKEVLARLRAVPLPRNRPKPHASRERTPTRARFSRDGARDGVCKRRAGVKSQAYIYETPPLEPPAAAPAGSGASWEALAAVLRTIEAEHAAAGDAIRRCSGHEPALG